MSVATTSAVNFSSRLFTTLCTKILSAPSTTWKLVIICPFSISIPEPLHALACIVSAYVGKVLKVLVEGYSKRNKNILSGYSEENKLVNFKGKEDMIGQIVDVKITTSKTWTLEGEAV